MADYSLDSDDCELRNLATGDVFPNWLEYTYNADFTTPTDAWSFKVGDERAAKELRSRIKPGQRVALAINDKVQCTGRVDGWEIGSQRSGGTIMTVSGRDALAVLVDAGICPLPINLFASNQTLNDVFRTVLPTYGFKLWSPSDLANRSVITGFNPAFIKRQAWPAADNARAIDGTTGDPVSGGASGPTLYDEYDPTKPDWFKNQLGTQVKPHPGEKAFEYLARICKRLALWLWCNALGDTVIVDQPDFKSASKYELYHKAGRTNYETASSTYSVKEAPAVIIATGVGASPEQPKAQNRVAMVNEVNGCDSKGNILPAVQAIIAQYKGIRVLPIRRELLSFQQDVTTFPYATYLHDDESKTPGQLEGFVRREMADRQANMFSLKVTVERHTQNGTPWNVNEMVDIDDDVLGIREAYWIKERTFRKSRAGTFTDLTLIRPNLLRYGP